MTRKQPANNTQHKSSSNTTSNMERNKDVVVGRKKGISDPPPPPLLPIVIDKEEQPLTTCPAEYPVEFEEPEIIYPDGEQDPMERLQEIEVLQSIYGEDFVMINDDQKSFEITIKGKLNFELPNDTDIANNHFSISEIPFRLSHVGLKLCIKYASGYPSQTLPKFKCIPLIDLDGIMSLVRRGSQVHAQLGLKKQMQLDEIEQIYEKIRAKSNELLGFVMIYSFIQEIEEYMDNNNVDISIAEEQFLSQQKEKKILKTSVVVSLIGDSTLTSDNVLNVNTDAKYKRKEESKEATKLIAAKEKVNWENIRRFKAKDRYSIESYVKVEASYGKNQVNSNFWLNRYGHAVDGTNNLWLSFGGIHEGRFTSDLVTFTDSTAKIIPVKEVINPRIFHTLNYIVSAEIFVILGGMTESFDCMSDGYFIDYQFKNPNIQRLPTFPQRICGHSAANYEEKLFVFGGYDGEKYNNNLWNISLRKPQIGKHQPTTWSKIDAPNGPSPRCGCSSVVFRDVLFVYGGNNDSTFFSDLYAFDLRMKYWTKLVSFGTGSALSYSQLFVTANNTLTVIGGLHEKYWNHTVMEYNIDRSTWSALKCDTLKGFDNRTALCRVLQDNQNFIFTGGAPAKSLNFTSITKISQSAPIIMKNMPDKADSLRKMTKRYLGTSEYSRNLFDVYYDMITSQIEKNSDFIINFYAKNEDGCTELRNIYAHQYVIVSNPIFRRILAIQNVRDRLNQQDYQYNLEADEENVLSFKNVHVDIQTFKGFEESTYNSILACLQFIYSYSFDPELARTDKECIELYETAKKFKLVLLCEMLCNSISTESLNLNISDFIEQSMKEFLKSEPVPSEEQHFLNYANEFETYVTDQTKDTPYVRIVAPDLYSKLDLDRARYLKSMKEETIDESTVEEIPEDSFDEELFEEIDSAKREVNWMTDVPKSDDLPELKWKYVIVHKSILVYRSKFFCTMFNMDFSESKTNEIRLNDTSMQSIEVILYWMYSGKFPNILSENAIELFMAATKYYLPEVRDWARAFIEKFIDIDNVLAIIDIADMIGDVNLKRYCIYFIANRYDIISRDPFFNEAIPSGTRNEIKSIHTRSKKKVAHLF